MKQRKLIQEITYVILLLLFMTILFLWYTAQNRERIKERNKIYAADSAQMKAAQIDDELNNALKRISTYAYFVGESLTEPMVTRQMLEKIEEKVVFDTVLFTDRNGVDYISDGRTADVTERGFYQDGIKGNNGNEVVFEPHFFDEIMMCFYAPVYLEGDLVGVLRGGYLAEEYLQDMLETTYFGEMAEVFLCTPDGRVVAHSDTHGHSDSAGNRHLIDLLMEQGVIDPDTAGNAKEIFDNGGQGAFICSRESHTDNLCVTYLPNNECVLVQIFPKNVTQNMIRAENLVGMRLEAMLIVLFVIYIIIRIAKAKQEKKQLEQENQEMGYIIDGIRKLFTRFALIDFEAETYQYLAGTKPENSNVAVSGTYQRLAEHLCAILLKESDRSEFAAQIRKEALIKALDGHNDVRFECHVKRGNQIEWEHVNVICLERKDGKASKLLFIRQNITEVKLKELRVQAEMALADRKERQYRIAITSNAFCTYELNRFFKNFF